MSNLPLYKYQEKMIDLLMYYGGGYWMAGMGTGKTRAAIEASKQMSEPMFILANKFAATNTWPDEFKKWAPADKYVVLHGKNKEQLWANSDKYTHIIINYDGLKWFYDVCQKGLRPLQKYFFVFDEASMIKNHESIRWKILHDMRPIMSQYKACLSGTPVPNNMTDLWAQYFMLDNGKALCPSFYQFRSRFFDYTGADGDPPYQTTIKPWAEDKIFDLIRPITMRLSTEDYHELPDLVMNNVQLKLPQKLRRQYDTLEEDFMLELEDTTVIANSSAVAGHKLRQFLQGAIYSTDLSEEGSSRHRLPTITTYIHTLKAQVVKELLQSAGGQPIMVAVQFKFELTILEKVLKRELPHITGGTTSAEGDRLIKMWNKKQLPILVVHPKSVAYGLNLQFGGNRIIMMALPWECDLFQQLIARLWRPGQDASNVIVTILSFKNTIDNKVAAYLKRKEQTQDGLFQAMRQH